MSKGGGGHVKSIKDQGGPRCTPGWKKRGEDPFLTVRKKVRETKLKSSWDVGAGLKKRGGIKKGTKNKINGIKRHRGVRKQI